MSLLNYVSNKFEVSATFRFRVNRRQETDCQTDGRTGGNTTLIALIQGHLGGAATMRARCWCFALCEDSGMQCTLFSDI